MDVRRPAEASGCLFVQPTMSCLSCHETSARPSILAARTSTMGPSTGAAWRMMPTTHVPAVVLLHDLQQHECADDVVVVVLEGDLDALTHSLEPSKVDDGIKLLLAKQLVQGGLVAHITLQPDNSRHRAGPIPAV